MIIKNKSMAGTLESSDVLVTVEPGQQGIQLQVSSPVIQQFGRAIKATVLDTMARLGVEHAQVTVADQGALDCTLKARLECAVYRANGTTVDIPWGKEGA